MDRSKTLAFNYASLALNNNFFLEQLKPPPPPPTTTHEGSISNSLHGQIRQEHGNIQQLKSNFSAAALGLSSSGWVWFVTDGQGKTAVLPTFGAGTLLVRSRMHVAPELGKVTSGRQSPPHSSYPSPILGPSPTPGLSHSLPINSNPNSSRFFHSSIPLPFDDLRAKPPGIYSAQTNQDILPNSNHTDLVNLGDTLYPLFCLSVYEHAWMSAGYGVWGKEEWVKKFWTVVDWGKVSANYAKLVDRQTTF